MGRSFVPSLADSSVAFTVYVLSMIAALSWNNAVQNHIKTHEKWWARWLWAFGMTVFALVVITIIMVYRNNDDSGNGQARTTQQQQPANNNALPVMGRMVVRP